MGRRGAGGGGAGRGAARGTTPTVTMAAWCNWLVGTAESNDLWYRNLSLYIEFMLVVTLNSAESQRNRFGLASQPQFRLIYVPTWYFSVLEYYILNVNCFISNILIISTSTSFTNDIIVTFVTFQIQITVNNKYSCTIKFTSKPRLPRTVRAQLNTTQFAMYNKKI